MPHIDPAFLDGVLAARKEEAPSDAVRVKLDNLHQVCRDLGRAGIRLTVPAVIAEYGHRFCDAAPMAESSLRNKRDGKNLYNRLFTAWSDWSKGETKSVLRPGEWILPAELSSIPNEQLRHRIALMAADAHSLRSQLNILQQVSGDGVVRIEGSAPVIDGARAFPSGIEMEDLEAFQDFLDPRKLKARGLTLRGDRALVGSTGGVVADPGFFDALKKLVATVRP